MDHRETIFGLSIYVSFKLHTYYHSITRKTNCINLNILNTLKHGNNAEFILFSGTEIAFFFLLLSKPRTPEVKKTFRKKLLIRKLNFCIK